MKNKKFLTVLIIVVLFLMTAFIIVNKTNHNKSINSSKYEKIVEEIIKGNISVSSNGNIKLTNNLKDLSVSGECFMVEYEGGTAIYCYSYRGILDSSKGYLYVTDKLDYKDYINTDKYVITKDFVNIKKVDDNLFSCSTK